MARRRLTAARNIGERALTIQGKRPTLGGTISLYPSRKGGIVAMLPNRKPPSRWTERQKAVHWWLRYSAWLYKLADPYIISEYRRQSLGLWLQPRDIYTASLAGRLFYFDLGTRRLYSRRMRNDMSYTLDILGESPGMILYRGFSDWQALLPGNPGEVLAVGASGLPIWTAPGGGAGLFPATWRGAVELYASGQGHALDVLPDGRRAIRLYGSVSGAVEALFYVGAWVPDLYGRALLSSMYAPGGDYLIQWKFEVWARAGYIITSSSYLVVVSGIPSGESRLISSPSFQPPNLGGGFFVRAILQRLGGDTADSSSAQLHLLALGLEG